MSNPFAQAALHGFKSMQLIHGVSITYQRPSTGHSVTLTAPAGRSDHDVSQDGMVIEQVKSRDYLVKLADLVLNGVEVLPIKGDRIVEGSKTYAVLCMGTESQWKYTDPSQQIIRIHTREM